MTGDSAGQLARILVPGLGVNDWTSPFVSLFRMGMAPRRWGSAGWLLLDNLLIGAAFLALGWWWSGAAPAGGVAVRQRYA